MVELFLPVLEFWRRSHHFRDYSSWGENIPKFHPCAVATLHLLTIPMAMLATLIQTAAMSVADLGEGPNIFRPNWEKRKKFFWDRASHLSQGLEDCPPSFPSSLSECLDLPLHVVHLCICHPLEFPFVTENRLDRDTPLKFDIWHSLTAGVEWRADGGGGHSYSKTPHPIEKEIWRLSH